MSVEKIVESIARLDENGKYEFAEMLSQKWPHLARTIADEIYNHQQDDDGQPDWHQEWEDFGECYEQHFPVDNIRRRVNIKYKKHLKREVNMQIVRSSKGTGSLRNASFFEAKRLQEQKDQAQRLIALANKFDGQLKFDFTKSTVKQ